MSRKLQENKIVVFLMKKKKTMLAFEWKPQIHKGPLNRFESILESTRDK